MFQSLLLPLQLRRLVVSLFGLATLLITLPATAARSGFLLEGFESTTFPPAGWRQESVLGSNVWARSTAEAKQGSASAYMRYQTSGGQDWLIMPHFLVTAGDSVVFWLKLDFQGYAPDSLTLLASTTDSAVGSFATRLLSLKEGVNYPGDDDNWYRYGVSLSAFAGQKVYLAFRHANVDGDGVYLDQIELGTRPAADVALTGLSLPGAPAAGTTYTPQATVQNNGTQPQSFSLTLTIGPYSSTQPVTNLAPNSSTTVLFDPWTPTGAGTHTAELTATLPGDGIPADNQLSRPVTIYNTLSTASAPTWETGVPMPSARWAHGLASNDVRALSPDSSFVYAVGGADGSFAHTASVQRFSPATGQWRDMAPLPVARMQVAAHWINGKLYVAGGYTGSFAPTARLDIYDPATDSWTPGANMLQAVGDYASGVYHDSLLYIIGGYTGSGDVALVQIYNPATDTWSSGTAFAGIAVAGSRGAIAGNQIVVAGGYNQTLASSQSQAWKGTINPANPTQITWTALPAYPAGPVGRLGAGALALGPTARVYFAGGDPNGQGTQTLTGAYAYDLTINEWLVAPPLQVGVSNIINLAAMVQQDSVYLVNTGGYNGVSVVATTQLLNLGHRNDLFLSDLIVDDTRSVAGGQYHDVTITGTGNATFTASLDAAGSVTVETGGTLRLEAPLVGSASFTMQPGSTLALTDPAGLRASSASGAVQVTGTRTFASDAHYLYAGTTAQQTGDGLPATVRDLTVDNPASVTVTNPLGITRVLAVAGTGNLEAGEGNLTLLSDATGTAMVVNASTGAVTGTTTVQRYITPNGVPGLGYRHFSSPVTNSVVADLSCPGFTPVVNAAFNTASAPTLVRPYPNVFGFNETRYPASADFSRGYFSPTALSNPLVPGRGYSVYFPGTSKPDFVGTLGNGDLTMTGLTKTGGFTGPAQKSGWHLLGNPYPAPIDWDLVSVPAGMSSSVSVYQTTGGINGQYLTRANGMGTLPDGLIAMGQGIFVRVLTATPVNFTFTNAQRVTTYANPAHYRPAADPRPALTLALRAAGAGEADEAVVYFQEGATSGLDGVHDGEKPAHNDGLPTLVSLTPDAAELAVNGLPEQLLETGTVVELLVDLPAGGRYELTAPRLVSLPAHVAPLLLDRLTGTHYDLRMQPMISFTADRAGETRGRFALVFGPANGPMGTASSAALTAWPNPAHGTLHVSLSGTVARLTLHDALGRPVLRQGLMAADEVHALDVRHLKPGVYFLSVEGENARPLPTQRIVLE